MCFVIPSRLTDTESDERKLLGHTIARLKGKYANVVERIKRIFEEKNYKIDQLILNSCATDEENQTIFSAEDAFVKIKKTQLVSITTTPGPGSYIQHY